MTATMGARQRVLKNWGDSDEGPMNGAVGQGLAETMVRIVRAQLDVKTICDLGCGTGYLAARLGALGFRVTGVDASDRLLEVARKNYESEKVSFVHAVFGDDSLDALALGGPFDLVISSDVIEHLFVPTSLTETAFQVLKPGGRLILGTPYHGYLKNVAISALGQWDLHHSPHWDGGHIKFFSVASLEKMVRRAGFDVVGFRYYGRVPWLWKNMICLARKAPE